jgi:hypothetical protein
MIVSRSKILRQRNSESMPRSQQWKSRRLRPWEGPFADPTPWLPQTADARRAQRDGESASLATVVAGGLPTMDCRQAAGFADARARDAVVG